MSGWRTDRSRPLVALIWTFEVVAAALEDAIEFADVWAVDARKANVSELLSCLKPDAIVVDDGATAELAAPYARQTGVALLYLGAREGTLRMLLAEDGWVRASGYDDPDERVVQRVLGSEFFGVPLVKS